MLAKIHLKTACGCAKEFFQHVERPLPKYWEVPIRVHSMSFDLWKRETWTRRRFYIVDAMWRSSRRVELWYEEVS